LKHKILHGIYDCTVSPSLFRCEFTAAMGNDFKLVKHYCKYDTRKYFLLKELLLTVNSSSVNSFKINLDKCIAGVVKILL